MFLSQRTRVFESEDSCFKSEDLFLKLSLESQGLIAVRGLQSKDSGSQKDYLLVRGRS